jgi:hypothetical protein
VEQTYLRTATDLDFGESEARDWISAIMDCLRTEVEERVRREMQVADYDGFVSLEKTLSLLLKAQIAARVINAVDAFDPTTSLSRVLPAPWCMAEPRWCDETIGLTTIQSHALRL